LSFIEATFYSTIHPGIKIMGKFKATLDVDNSGEFLLANKEDITRLKSFKGEKMLGYIVIQSKLFNAISFQGSLKEGTSNELVWLFTSLDNAFPNLEQCMLALDNSPTVIMGSCSSFEASSQGVKFVANNPNEMIKLEQSGSISGAVIPQKATGFPVRVNFNFDQKLKTNSKMTIQMTTIVSSTITTISITTMSSSKPTKGTIC
jgi:hypothetical protein